MSRWKVNGCLGKCCWWVSYFPRAWTSSPMPRRSNTGPFPTFDFPSPCSVSKAEMLTNHFTLINYWRFRMASPDYCMIVAIDNHPFPSTFYVPLIVPNLLICMRWSALILGDTGLYSLVSCASSGGSQYLSWTCAEFDGIISYAYCRCLDLIMKEF